MLVAVEPKGQRSMGKSKIKAFVRQNKETGSGAGSDEEFIKVSTCLEDGKC